MSNSNMKQGVKHIPHASN